MPIRNEEVTVILCLQRFPVLQGTEIVSKMHEAAGLHAAEDSLVRSGHSVTPGRRPSAVDKIVPDSPLAKVPVIIWMTPSSLSNTMSPTKMSMPYGSNRANVNAGFGGSRAVRIRPPSSGGIGSRLNRARKTLIITEYNAMTAIGRNTMVATRLADSSP